MSDEYPTSGDYEQDWEQRREICENCNHAKEAKEQWEEYLCSISNRIMNGEDSCSHFENESEFM